MGRQRISLNRAANKSARTCELKQTHMPPNAVATNPRSSSELISKGTDLPMRPLSPLEPGSDSTDSLFERVAWLYAFCRERLFRDDTERMISALWQDQLP